MKKIYYLTHDEEVFKEFEVADDFPTPLDNNFVDVAPQSNIKYPTWNDELKRWEEDKDKLISDLQQQITDLQTALVTNFESEVG